jgi:multidrug resistance efflux pump
LRNNPVYLPGKVTLSHLKVRNYLILSFLAVGLLLVGTNHALHPHGGGFINDRSIYDVAFEGTVHPASEVRITAALSGTVSRISVKVGDSVQPGQELLRMDDREAELTVKQAGVELEAAKAKLDKFRLQLAEASARVAISQRQEQLVPSRQWRDSPERAEAVYDLAVTNYNRAQKLYEAGIISHQELDARGTELRVARDDLQNARELARVSAKLERDQTEQVTLQEKVTRAELHEQLHQAQLGYERAIQQLDAMVVRATTAGVVSEISAHLGDRVPGGTVLARMAELRRLLAEVPVAAQTISRLKVGQPARVRLSSSPARDLDGRILVINPLPSANMTHVVEVEFDNPTLLLLAGQPAQVRFLTQ